MKITKKLWVGSDRFAAMDELGQDCDPRAVALVLFYSEGDFGLNMIKHGVPFLERPEYITAIKTQEDGYDIWKITTEEEIWLEWETFLEKHKMTFGKPI